MREGDSSLGFGDRRGGGGLARGPGLGIGRAAVLRGRPRAPPAPALRPLGSGAVRRDSLRPLAALGRALLRRRLARDDLLLAPPAALPRRRLLRRGQVLR